MEFYYMQKKRCSKLFAVKAGYSPLVSYWEHRVRHRLCFIHLQKYHHVFVLNNIVFDDFIAFCSIHLIDRGTWWSQYNAARPIAFVLHIRKKKRNSNKSSFTHTKHTRNPMELTEYFFSQLHMATSITRLEPSTISKCLNSSIIKCNKSQQITTVETMHLLLCCLRITTTTRWTTDQPIQYL